MLSFKTMLRNNAFASTLATATLINLPAQLISIGMSILAHVGTSSRTVHALMDNI
jgi:hypothetical protein